MEAHVRMSGTLRTTYLVIFSNFSCVIKYMVNGEMSVPLKRICNNLAWIGRLEINIKLPLPRLPGNEKEENMSVGIIV